MNEEYYSVAFRQRIKQSTVSNYTNSASVQKAIRQYETKQKAENFHSRMQRSATNYREKSCISKAFAFAKVPRGAHVLDLPCGTGRLLPLLKKMGYKVTGADISSAMLEQARFFARAPGENVLYEKNKLCIANIFQTGFSDNSFDAVVCNRLLQYFPEAEIRQRALRELGRICSGPIVVSFLCNFAIDEVFSNIREAICRRKPHGCVAISLASFIKDVQQAGLVVKKWIPMRPLVSRRWYAVLERHNMVCNSTTKHYNTFTWPKLSSRFGRVAAIAAVILIGFSISLNITGILDPHEREVERIVREYQDGNDKFYVSAHDDLEDLQENDNLSIIENIDIADVKIADDQSHSKDSFFLISEKDRDKLKKKPMWMQLSFVKKVNIGNEHFILMSTEKKSSSFKIQTPKSNPEKGLTRIFAVFC